MSLLKANVTQKNDSVHHGNTIEAESKFYVTH